jgi:hypothetical protein
VYRSLLSVRTLIFLFSVLATFPQMSLAQSETVAPAFFFGGGPTFTTNQMNNYVKHGFHFDGGAGVRFGRSLELLGEFNYHELGVQDQAIQTLQVPDANARVYSVGAAVKIPFKTRGVRPYAILGGGWYRRTVEFTEPATGVVTVFDPWWGWLGDVAVPTNRVLGSVSRNAGGVNAGGGVSFPIGDGTTRFFAEVRWHRAFQNPTNTTLVPITIGLSF